MKIKDRLRGHWNALCSYLVAPQCDVKKTTTDMAPDWSIRSQSPVEEDEFWNVLWTWIVEGGPLDLEELFSYPPCAVL